SSASFGTALEQDLEDEEEQCSADRLADFPLDFDMSFAPARKEKIMLGARAEPKIIRAPTTLANITSFVSGISSYVTQNLPEKFGGQAPVLLEHGDDAPPASDTVLCAKFAWVNWDVDTVTRGEGRPKRPFTPYGSKRLCLMLGYDNGFQVWNVTNPENIREVVSVREEAGPITACEAIPYQHASSTEYKRTEEVQAAHPLMALATELDADGVTDLTQTRGALKLFSLRQQKHIRTFTFGEDEHVLSVKCSERVMVVALSSSALHVFSLFNLNLMSVLTDTTPPPGSNCPVFNVGSRYLIYACSTPVPAGRRKSATGTVDGDDDSDIMEEPEDGIGKVAGKVAKELMGGVKVIGGMGYQALSNYFSSSPQQQSQQNPYPLPHSAPAPPPPSQHERRASISKQADAERKRRDNLAQGVIMIRDIHPSLLTSELTRSTPLPVLSHWKPHTNPVSIIAVNPTETLVVTASSIANNFYVFAVPGGPPRVDEPHHPRGVRCLYKLERGYTAATVEDVAFSLDGGWIGVSTGRGTTHLYRIDDNPLGVSGSRTSATTLELGVLNGLAEARPGPSATLSPG
ncbi:hypothetical protein HK101_006074, partial [Irineochytrium annulatum]